MSEPSPSVASATEQIISQHDDDAPTTLAMLLSHTQEQPEQQEERQGLILPTQNEFHAEITDCKHSPSSEQTPTRLAPTAFPSFSDPSTMFSPAISDPELASEERQVCHTNPPTASDTPVPSETSSPLAHATQNPSPAALPEEIKIPSHSNDDPLEADPPSPILPSPEPLPVVAPTEAVDIPTLPESVLSSESSIPSTTEPHVLGDSTRVAEAPGLDWSRWSAGRTPTLNVDISPDSEAPMSSTVSVASSAASSSSVSDATASSSSGQEDVDGDSTAYESAPKHHSGRRASYGRHRPHHHHHQQYSPTQYEAPSAYDADEDFSGSELSTSSCESCCHHYSSSRGNSSEFSDRSDHYEPPPPSPPPKHPHQPATSSTNRPSPTSGQPQQTHKASRPSSSGSSFKPSSTSNSSGSGSSKSRLSSGLGQWPSASQMSKTVLEFMLVGALMVTIVSAAFTFSYVATATNHAGQKLRAAIEARERSVQRALERAAGEEFVKIRRRQQQQQQRQHHYHGTAQKQPGMMEDDRLSPAEWQELIHAAVYGLLSKWTGPGMAR